MSSVVPPAYPEYNLSSGMLARNGPFNMFSGTVGARGGIAGSGSRAAGQTGVGSAAEPSVVLGGEGSRRTARNLTSEFFSRRRSSTRRSSFTPRHVNSTSYAAPGPFSADPNRVMYSQVVAAGYGHDADLLAGDDGLAAAGVGGAGGTGEGRGAGRGPDPSRMPMDTVPPPGIVRHDPIFAPSRSQPTNDPGGLTYMQHVINNSTQQMLQEQQEQPAYAAATDSLAGRFAAMGMGPPHPFFQQQGPMAVGDPYQQHQQAVPLWRSQRSFSTGHAQPIRPGAQRARHPVFQGFEQEERAFPSDNIYSDRQPQVHQHRAQGYYRDTPFATGMGMGRNMNRDPFEPIDDHFQWVGGNPTGMPGQFGSRPPSHDHLAVNYEQQAQIRDIRAPRYRRELRPNELSHGGNDMFRGATGAGDPFQEMNDMADEGDRYRNQSLRLNDRSYTNGYPSMYVGGGRTALAPLGDRFVPEVEDSNRYGPREGPFGRSHEFDIDHLAPSRSGIVQMRSYAHYNQAGRHYSAYGHRNQEYGRYQGHDEGAFRDYAMHGAGRRGGRNMDSGDLEGFGVGGNRSEYYGTRGPYEASESRPVNERSMTREGFRPYGEDRDALISHDEAYVRRGPSPPQLQDGLPRPRSYPNLAVPNPLTRTSRHAMYPGLNSETAPEIIRLLRRHERYSGRGRSMPYQKPDKAELCGFLAGKLLSSAGITAESYGGTYAEYLDMYMKGQTKFGNGDEELCQFRALEQSQRHDGAVEDANAHRLRSRQGYADESETSTNSEH